MREKLLLASTAAILAAVLVVLQPNSSIVFADEPLGARIAEEARALIGTAPYATNPADCDQNPCNGWLVCTDVVAVATDRAGVPISEDFCACTKMRRTEYQLAFFEGNAVAGSNTSLERHYEPSGSANPPAVGNIIIFSDHVAVVVDVESAGAGKLAIETVETRGGSAANNIGNREYSLVEKNGGWYFDGGHRYSLIKGWGVIDEAASEVSSGIVVGDVRAAVEEGKEALAPGENPLETAKKVVQTLGWLRENGQLVVVAGLFIIIFVVLIFVDNLMMRSGRKFTAKRLARWLWRLGWVLLFVALTNHNELLKQVSLISLGLGAFYKVSAWWDRKRRDHGWLRVLPIAVSYVGEFFLISLALAYLLGIILGLSGAVGVGPSMPMPESSATPVATAKEAALAAAPKPVPFETSAVLPDPGPSLEHTVERLRVIAQEERVPEELLLPKFWAEGGYWWNPETGDWSSAPNGQCDGCQWVGLRQYLPDGSVVESYSGSHGISQIYVKVHPEYDVEKAEEDWEYTARYGARYLRSMYDLKGSWSGAVMKYHSPGEAAQGLAKVETWLEHPPTNPETGQPVWQEVSQDIDDLVPATAALPTPQPIPTPEPTPEPADEVPTPTAATIEEVVGELLSKLTDSTTSTSGRVISEEGEAPVSLNYAEIGRSLNDYGVAEDVFLKILWRDQEFLDQNGGHGTKQEGQGLMAFFITRETDSLGLWEENTAKIVFSTHSDWWIPELAEQNLAHELLRVVAYWGRGDVTAGDEDLFAYTEIPKLLAEYDFVVGL